MNATNDQVYDRVDYLIEKFAAFAERNDSDHATMGKEQKAIAERLADIDIHNAVVNTNFKTHTTSCDKRHGFLNKILWTFAGAGFLAAVGLIVRVIIGGEA